MNLSDRIAETNFLGNPGGNSFVGRRAERNVSEMEKNAFDCFDAAWLRTE